MSRTLVAVVLFALAVGAAAGAAPPPAADDPAAKVFQVDVQGSIAEVIRIVTTASGASIAMDGDVTGTITLCQPNATVERVLEQICQAKGYSWWKDAQGGYVISSKPKAGDNQAQVVPGLPSKPNTVTRMQKLQFVSPQFVVYQLGLSDYAGEEEYMRDPEYVNALVRTVVSGPGELHGAGRMGGGGGGGGGGRGGGGGGGFGGGGGGGARAGGGGGARAGGGGGGVVRGAGGGGGAGGGALGTFLPEGISEIVAFPMLNSLLVRGTEEGIDRFIEFLKLIDRKPQQILVEIQSVVVQDSVAKAFGLSWFYNVGNLTIQPSPVSATASSVKIGYNPPGVTNFRATLTYLLATSQGKVTDAIRVATMNLMTATHSVTTNFPVVTTTATTTGGIVPTTSTSVTLNFIPVVTFISITPRINGDGTITMTIPFQKTDVVRLINIPTGDGTTTSEVPLTAQTSISTTLNVRDGETFVIGGSVSNRDFQNEDRFPFLSELPLIGKLFVSHSRNVGNSETLIFITPRVIKEEAAPASIGVI